MPNINILFLKSLFFKQNLKIYFNTVGNKTMGAWNAFVYSKYLPQEITILNFFLKDVISFFLSCQTISVKHFILPEVLKFYSPLVS